MILFGNNELFRYSSGIPKASRKQLKLRDLCLDRGDMGQILGHSSPLLWLLVTSVLSSLFFLSPTCSPSHSVHASFSFMNILLHAWWCTLCMHHLVYTELRDSVWEQTMTSKSVRHHISVCFLFTWPQALDRRFKCGGTWNPFSSLRTGSLWSIHRQ